MFLLDTNVLFAAIYQAHIHHGQVSRWLTAEERYATCGLTQIGAFRLLIMPKAMHDSPLDPITAHEVLSDFSNSERHAFLACPAPSADRLRGTKPRLTTISCRSRPMRATKWRRSIAA